MGMRRGVVDHTTTDLRYDGMGCDQKQVNGFKPAMEHLTVVSGGVSNESDAVPNLSTHPPTSPHAAVQNGPIKPLSGYPTPPARELDDLPSILSSHRS